MSEKIGLALGGGSARGLAHIGVIDALEEHGISPSIVTGTSIGSIMGAAYAAGEHEKFKDFLLTVDLWKMLSFFEVNLPRKGLFDGRKISRFFEENLNIANIEDLEKKFAAVSCDYETGERVVFDHGDMITALRASYSIPGVFTPMKYKGRLLVDGGLVDPVPVTAARDLGAEVVIAVDLNHHVRWRGFSFRENSDQKNDWNITKHPLWVLLENKFGKKSGKEISPGMIEILLDSVYMIEKNLTDYELQLTKPEIIIRPNLKNITFFDFHKAKEGISIGKKVTEDMMDEISRALDQ